MRYYISDLHFFHRRIKEMDQRDFETLFEMHEYILERWNQKVRKNDEVFILGDLSFGDGLETYDILSKLNGKLTLIEGNHDHRFLDDKNFVDNFENVVDYDEKRDDGRIVIMSHYPMPFYNSQFRKDESGALRTYMLYGHVHNTFDEYLLNRTINDIQSHERKSAGDLYGPTPIQMINVFCLFADYEPKSLDEWIEIDRKRRELINEREKENNGLLTYDQWEELNLEIVQKSKDHWQ